MPRTRRTLISFFFFLNDPATTEISTLPLPAALPISGRSGSPPRSARRGRPRSGGRWTGQGDRKSTRLNSSHSQISYAVFCLKKKKKIIDGLRIDCVLDHIRPSRHHGCCRVADVCRDI